MKNWKFFLASIAMTLPMLSFATGAIAVDDQVGDEEPGYGIAVGKNGKDEALRAAVAECRRAGNRNCKAMVWFEGCGAYASSKNYYGIGFGKTLRAAEKMALDKCGKASCEVHVSECDE